MSNHDEVAIPNSSERKTLKAYVIGFVLCIALTMVAFTLVGKHLLSTDDLYISLAGLAVVQLFVQSICFLRLNAGEEGRWNLMPFLFTVFIVSVLVGGSLWIMYNLNYNMVN